MPLSSDILKSVPKRLANPSTRTEADLRRATSDLYFALFHRVCETLVQPLAGDGSDVAFKYVYELMYRLPEHGYLEKRCREVSKHRFSQEVKSFANRLVVMKNKRERADYDPITKFPISDVQTDIQTVQSVLKGFDRADSAEQLRFAYFAAMRTNRK